MEIEQSGIDTQGTEAQDTSNAPEVTDPSTQSSDEQANSDTAAEAVRKWKLKVYGEEKEYSEPEVIKFAQMGAAGQKAMEKAAGLEKKHREFYGWLKGAVEKDPIAAAEIILGRKLSSPGKQMNAQVEGDAQPEQDPLDLKLRERDDRIQKLEERLEREEIEKERKLIETELDDAVKKYPELDNQFLRSYVKSEYRKALKNGVDDLAIEDVAFFVQQQWKEEQAKKTQAVQKNFEEKKQKSPVITKPAQGSGNAKKMTLDDVKKLAGRI